MTKKKHTTKKVIAKPKAIKLNAFKFGLAGGIISAICISLCTIVSIFGYSDIQSSIMMDMYSIFGYSTSWLGVLLGGIYGFLDGFFMVWIFALIYNRLIR